MVSNVTWEWPGLLTRHNKTLAKSPRQRIAKDCTVLKVASNLRFQLFPPNWVSFLKMAQQRSPERWKGIGIPH